MKNLINNSIIAIILATFTYTASAVEISGNILFSGTATFDGAAPSSSTAVTSWGSPTVLLADGDFTGVGPAAVFSAPWSFNSGPLAALWSVGGFTFDLTSSSIVTQPAGVGVTVKGTGVVSGNGYDPTNGSWFFSSQDVAVGNNFSFSASSAVPDAGSTAALLGLGILGLAAASRRMRK